MSNIKSDMIDGVFWSAVEKYSGLVVSIIITMVLARLLSPKEFGVVAIATVLIYFFQMFCTMGIGPAVIQRDDLTQKDLNSIFTFSITIGLLFAFIFGGSAWGIASFYDNNQLIPVCLILSVQLFFSAANLVPNALMAKNKRFKNIAQRTLSLQISSGILSVMAALAGAGIYALLISPIISSIGIFIWNRKYYKVNMDWTYNLEPIRRILSFSGYQFLFEFVNYFSRNMDKLIIGKILNVDALGIYEKSYRLMQLPMNNLTGVLNPVMQPILKDLQNDKDELGCKYIRIIRLLATIGFPIGIMCSCMSAEIIRFFFGYNWDCAIPVFSILSLSLPLQIIVATSGAIYLVCNNTKMQFWIGIRNTFTTILGFIISASFFRTIESIAWAWTISLIINFIVSYYLMFNKLLHMSLKKLFMELVNPAINMIVLLGTYQMLSLVYLWENNLFLLITKGMMGVFVSITYIQLTGRYNIIKIINRKIK